MKATVQIKVKGHLGKQWEEMFHGMRFSYGENITILTGRLQDYAELYGVLITMRDLNLKLISLNPLGPDKNPHPN